MSILLWTAVWLTVGAFFVRAPLLAIPLGLLVWWRFA